VYAVFAAPFVLTGEPTFGGYIKLDDTATWLAFTDRIMEHGRNLNGLAPSSYETTLAVNLPGGYPIGSLLPFGVGRALVGQDGAWVFQPYLAFLAAMLATTLYEIAGQVVRSRALSALAAFIASQAALLFGYALWGGVKELAAAWAIGLAAAMVGLVAKNDTTARSVIPLAFASAAALAVLSFGGAVWLAPLLLAGVLMVVRSAGLPHAGARAAAFLAFAAVLSLPSILQAKTFLKPAEGTLTSGTDLGNLFAPLSWLQFFGIWPVGDFRLRPESIDEAHILIVVVVIAGVIGLALAWRRDGTGLIAYVAGASLGCLIVTSFGSPWVDAKALATASPAFLLAALVAAGAVAERGRALVPALAIAAIGGGVLWSNALAYKDVNLAPHDRFAELQKIGERYAGQGPALMTEYEPYGVRHFLRKLDAEGASELRRRLIPLRNGRSLDKLEVVDLDRFQLGDLLVYRTIVLRTSPVESRPPAQYSLVSHGRFYDVWQRPAVASGIATDLPLGGGFHPSGRASCSRVTSLARAAGPNGQLVAAVRKYEPVVADLTQAPHPPRWEPAGVPGGVTPATAGTVTTTVAIPAAGRYEIWIGGAFRREVAAVVNGRVVARRRGELSHNGQYFELGKTVLSPGVYSIGVRYGKADLHPGSGAPPFYLGPLVLTRGSAESLRYVPSSKARSLCGGQFDWIEAIQ
jgi:hypothetical protein